MKRNIQPPARLERAASAETIDLEARTIEATVATRLLARDGGIVQPRGIVTRAFEANPNVLAMHGGISGKFPVVGRCVALQVNDRGVLARTQFADTEIGREIGYLYGINPKKEVFCRGWSFGWNTLQMRVVTLDEARTLLDSDWDEELVPAMCRRFNEVWIAERSEMLEYSPVPVGADRAALSRAFSDGVRAAGELVAHLDLKQASEELTDLKREHGDLSARVERMEKQIQALCRDGAAAAARGDSAGLLKAIEQLRMERR